MWLLGPFAPDHKNIADFRKDNGLALRKVCARFVDAEVSRVLTFPILISALEDAHRRPKIEVLDGYLGNEKEQYVIRSAVDRGRYMASKMFTSFPANLAGGMMPAVQAVCVLFDGSNGRPLAVMDGAEITHWRTAANSALGAKFLAPLNPETMLVVGAGEMSRWLVRAHRAVRPSLQRVFIGIETWSAPRTSPSGWRRRA